jgi:hypothetical protein
MRDGGVRSNDGLLGCDEILKEAEVLVAAYSRESCTLMRDSSRRAAKHNTGKWLCTRLRERDIRSMITWWYAYSSVVQLYWSWRFSSRNWLWPNPFLLHTYCRSFLSASRPKEATSRAATFCVYSEIAYIYMLLTCRSLSRASSSMSTSNTTLCVAAFGVLLGTLQSSGFDQICGGDGTSPMRRAKKFSAHAIVWIEFRGN